MSVRSFQHCWNSQAGGCLERPQGGVWPSMNDVDLAHQFLDPTGHNIVVKGQSTHISDELVGNSDLPPRQSGTNLYGRGNWLMKHSRIQQHVCSGRRESVHLL